MEKELLKQFLIGAEKAHAAYENSIGGKHADWVEFYAQFMFERLSAPPLAARLAERSALPLDAVDFGWGARCGAGGPFSAGCLGVAWVPC